MLHGNRQLRSEMRPPGARRCSSLLVVALTGLMLGAPAKTALASFTQEPGSPIQVGPHPYGVLVADFNGDQIPDVITINGFFSPGSASVLLRQPLGGFAEEAGSPLAVGNSPGFGAVSDFNADGHPDIAVGNFASDDVTILVRQPGSGFAQALGSPILAGDGPSDVAAADFDGDGLTDLAVSDFLAARVTILLQQPGGAFMAEAASPATGDGPRKIATADFNGDKLPDLAVTNLNSNNVTILLRNAGGGFTQEPGSPIPVVAGPYGIAADDLNVDGRPDVVVVNSRADKITVLLRNAGGGFTQEGGPIAVGANPLDVTTGDFNSDGTRDLAVTNNAGDSVSVLLRAGAGYTPDAGSPVPVPAATGAFGVKSADFNADGRPDLAVSNDKSGKLSILLNSTPPGSPAPTPVRPSSSSPSQSPRPRPGVKRIRSTVTVEWSVLKRSTTADTIFVRGVPAGGKVVVRCKGHDCQFKGPRTFKRKKSTTVSLTKAFKHKRLPVGAVIDIAISAPNRIGKVVRFKVRSDVIPKKSILCLPAGSSKPRLKC